MSDLDWRHRARCLGHDPELWFPDATNDAQKEEAKAICMVCPVRDECLAFALKTGQGAGVWGGKDEAELRQLRRQQVRHGTGYAYNAHECRCPVCVTAHAKRLQRYRRDKRNRRAS